MYYESFYFKEKFQPSYDYTVFIETFPSSDPATIECDLQSSPIVQNVNQQQQQQTAVKCELAPQQFQTASVAGMNGEAAVTCTQNGHYAESL